MSKFTFSPLLTEGVCNLREKKKWTVKVAFKMFFFSWTAVWFTSDSYPPSVMILKGLLSGTINILLWKLKYWSRIHDQGSRSSHREMFCLIQLCFKNIKCAGVNVFFIYVLLVLQAMAALASSKEADWNAMRLRLANISTTVVRLLTNFWYLPVRSFCNACTFAELVTVCTTLQNGNEPFRIRIFIDLNDKNLDVILSLN